MTMGSYYRETWWLWIIFVIVFAVLGYYVVPLFFIFIPGLIAYSVYFGSVRVSEFQAKFEAEAKLEKVARSGKPQV